ncbi:MAG: hypothetical protein LBE13_04890 [Bacteroidales bacterium]|jgi:hypothetical protein|nr:hypothetical protein [Bacteroidales bacterium]
MEKTEKNEEPEKGNKDDSGMEDAKRLDAALKKICADDYGDVRITDFAESTAFDKLCAYGCVKRSESQSRDSFGYKLTDEVRSFYRNGGFTKEQLMKDNIEASATAAKATSDLAACQKEISRWTLYVAAGTLIVLTVQVIFSFVK